MNRDAEGFGVLGTVMFFVLVLTPTAFRFVEWYESDAPPAAVTHETELAVELGEVTSKLRVTLDELESTSGFRFSQAELRERSRFNAVLCDAVPLFDPSPGRHGLLVIWPGDAESLPSDENPAAAAYGQKLAGVIRGVLSDVPAARLQLLSDPGFRVKFRCGEALGVLRGTGRNRDGRAELEVHHVTPLSDLEEGARVHTAGGDGIFPPGLLIGQVVPAGTGERQVVQAAVETKELDRVVALITSWPTIRGNRTFSGAR